jgi:hypothetical protein
MWCPCLAHARNRRRLEHLQRTGQPDPDRNGLCGPDGWLYACLEAACDVGWILQVGFRFPVLLLHGLLFSLYPCNSSLRFILGDYPYSPPCSAYSLADRFYLSRSKREVTLERGTTFAEAGVAIV